MSAADPPRFAAWVFDVEGDYRAVRQLDLPGATAVVEALLGDQDAAEAYLTDAAARNDLAAMLAAGAALQREKRLTGQARLLYASALGVEGDASKAAALYREVSAERPDDAVLLACVAELCGPAGEFEEGRRTAARSNALKPKPVFANLARRLKWIDKLWRNRHGLSWDDALRLIEGLHLIDASAPAAEAMGVYAALPPAGEPTPDQALRLAGKALALSLPALAAPYLARLSSQHDANADDPLRNLRMECAGRLGDTAAAARAADAIMARPGIRDRAVRRNVAAAYLATGRTADAVRELDALACEDGRDFVSLVALQRAVGQYVLGRLDLPWGPPRPPKVINLLPFYREQMLLDLRVAEMGDWVDYFVVSEAAETFTGRPKALHFAETRGRFAARGDQLLTVGVDGFPDFMRSAWSREFYQRDMAVAALAGVWRPDDVILITDADEIVDRRAFPAAWPDLANLRMATSQLFFNYVADPRSHHGNRRSGAVCRASTLARFGSSYVRTGLSAARKNWESVPNAGWHFTSLTDAEGLAAKFTDFSHQEDSKAALREVDGAAGVLAAVRAGVYQVGWSRRPIDERLPRYVRENRDRLAPLILKE